MPREMPNGFPANASSHVNGAGLLQRGFYQFRRRLMMQPQIPLLFCQLKLELVKLLRLNSHAAGFRHDEYIKLSLEHGASAIAP